MLSLERHPAEREYPHAIYTRSLPSADLKISPSGQAVRWSSTSEPDVDPPSGTHPIQIEVEAGDTLYLPAGRVVASRSPVWADGHSSELVV